MGKHFPRGDGGVVVSVVNVLIYFVFTGSKLSWYYFWYCYLFLPYR